MRKIIAKIIIFTFMAALTAAFLFAAWSLTYSIIHDQVVRTVVGLTAASVLSVWALMWAIAVEVED